MAGKLIAENRRARFDYFLEQTFEAGLALTGSEVKSLRVGRANIAESYAAVEGKETLYSFVSPDMRQSPANNLVTWDQVK